MKPVAGGLLLMTMACAPTPPAGGSENGVPVEAVDEGGQCSAEGLTDLVGRPATSEVGAEAMRRSGARALRWIRPGDAVTMDFRLDRLNVRLDGQNRVESLDCG
ncbi:MAG: I78 family peptidase inhibitor [Allosphingosinicella sp.]